MTQEDLDIADKTRPARQRGAAARVGVGAISPAEAGRLFEPLLGRRSRVLLAISGGADSTALLALAADWARERGGPELFTATVDHGLRTEASVEIHAVAALSANVGLAHARLSAPIDRDGSRIEEKARDARYAALARHAADVGADAIVTAHMLDDQAETVLMRLAAGSGPAGLAAMRAEIFRDGLPHARPLLATPKGRLVATLRARGLGWSEDAMNADERFARARLRASRAVLAREGLTDARLGVLAMRMARAEAALEHATEAAAAEHLSRSAARWTIAADAAALPAEIRLRLLARAVSVAGGGVLRLERLERLAERIASEPQGASTLAGARIAWRLNGTIEVSPAAPRRSLAPRPQA